MDIKRQRSLSGSSLSKQDSGNALPAESDYEVQWPTESDGESVAVRDQVYDLASPVASEVNKTRKILVGF